MPKAAPLLVIALLAALALPGTALADPDAEVAIMDDQLVLSHKPARVDGAMTVFARMGVDRVRISAYWRDIAPSPRSKRKPRRFDPLDHNSRRYDWAILDRVVSSARARGLRVLLSISTPAPIWATGAPSRKNPVWKPKPVEFARFAQAVATRYASQVDMYAVMNEPNQGAWLQPQSDRRGLYAPHHYRRIVAGAYPRIKAADPDSTVLIGELAPSGVDDRGTTRPIRPLEFLREMACVDRRARPRGGGPCRGFEPPQGDMIGHHPYQVLGDPSRRSRDRDDAAIGDAARLFATLDGLTAAGRLRSMQKPLFDVYYTEFGYQTNPPDRYSGISLKRQDAYLQEASYLTWLTPRVRGNTQFRLSDGELRRGARGRARYHEIQSGLLFTGDRPKPSYYNFFDPFWVTPERPRQGQPVRFWGQVRPGAEQQVTLEMRPGPGQPWTAVEALTTDANGYFERVFAAPTGEYRFTWADGRSATRTVRVR